MMQRETDTEWNLLSVLVNQWKLLSQNNIQLESGILFKIRIRMYFLMEKIQFLLKCKNWVVWTKQLITFLSLNFTSVFLLLFVFCFFLCGEFSRHLCSQTEKKIAVTGQREGENAIISHSANCSIWWENIFTSICLKAQLPGQIPSQTQHAQWSACTHRS